MTDIIVDIVASLGEIDNSGDSIHSVGSFSFSACLKGFENFSVYTVTGVGIDFTGEAYDPENELFASVSEAAEHYYTSIAKDHIIGNLNNSYDFLGTFVEGTLIYPEYPYSTPYPTVLTELNGKVDQTTTVNGQALSANVTLTKSDISLSNVDNTADASKSFTAFQVTDFSTATDARITAQKGAASGLCPLDSGSLVASAYLPSYVDDVLEYANLAALPGTGTSGKIYVTLDTNKCYRWSGSTYIEVSPGPGSTDSVAEGSTNLYFTNERAQDAVFNVLSGTNGVTVTYDDSGNACTIAPPVRTSSALSLSLVGTGATGTQISSTKDSTIRCNISTSATSSIGGPSTSVVDLKICSTNNATEGSWTTIATLENDQTITLALTLNSVQVVKGQLCADVPAGYYVKLVNSGSGTHSEAFITGQKTIYG